MHISVGIYARTSPDCLLSADEQIELLTVVAEQQSSTVAGVFTDRPTSVRKNRDRRPGEAALLSAIRNGNLQRVLIFGIDRIGKSLVELVNFMEMCKTARVSVYLHEQRIDTDGSNGLSLYDLSAMMAFHVHQSRRDRILRGQAAARNASVRFGRPTIPVAKVEKARQLLISGKGVREAGRTAGISSTSASRLKASLRMSPMMTAPN